MGKKLFAAADWDGDVPEMKDEENLTKQSKLKKLKRNVLKIQKEKETNAVENDTIDNTIKQNDDCFKVNIKNKKKKKHRTESFIINTSQNTKSTNEQDVLKINNHSTYKAATMESNLEKVTETTIDKPGRKHKKKKEQNPIIDIENTSNSNMLKKLTNVQQKKIKKQKKESAKTNVLKTFETEVSEEQILGKPCNELNLQCNENKISLSEIKNYNNIDCGELTTKRKLRNVNDISLLNQEVTNEDMLNESKPKKNKKTEKNIQSESLHNTESIAGEKLSEKNTNLKVLIESAINKKSQKNKKVRFLETSEILGIDEFKNTGSTSQKVNNDAKNNKKKNDSFNKTNDEPQNDNTNKKSKRVKISNITANLNNNDNEIKDCELVTKSMKKKNKRKIETTTQKEMNEMGDSSLTIQNKSNNKENRKKRKVENVLNKNNNIVFDKKGAVNTDENSKSNKKEIINISNLSNKFDTNISKKKNEKLKKSIKNQTETEDSLSNKSHKKIMKENKTKSSNSANHSQIIDETREDKKNKISNKSVPKLKAKPKVLKVMNTNMKTKIKKLVENDLLPNSLNTTKEVEAVPKTNSKAAKKAKSLRERMLEKLKGARLRYLNELMYTNNSNNTNQMFKEDPSSFKTYHEGYQQQVKKWPLNPLDVIIEDITKLPKSYKIADLGCGDARLAMSVPHEVQSFDFIAVNSTVIACDMAHTSLLTGHIDVAVFCLSLMGTNLKDYFIEANRILKIKGILKIAEVESRLENVENFISDIKKYGFSLSKKDLKNNFFYFLDFVKENDIKKRNKLPEIGLSPCLYKKR